MATLASDEELLRVKHFDALEPDELVELYRLMAQMRIATPVRRTRRARRDRRGERIDVRHTLRRSMRTGVARIVNRLGKGPFIFNLGHGIVPETPPEHVAELVKLVREG